MSGYPVSLEWHETVMAAHVALSRFTSGHVNHRNAATARPRRSHLSILLDGINGACGELAYCKAFGIHWDGSVGRFHEQPDIPQHNAEIRTTTYETGRLIVERSDRPAGRWFVLLTGEAPHYLIRGRIAGEHVREPRFDHMSTGGVPEWWIPQEELTPVVQYLRRE